MKILISYRQTGVEEIELIKNLTFIRKTLESIGHSVFIFFLDIDKNKTAKEVIDIAQDEIEKCDMVITFINHESKSEGMLLELGIAKGLNKKIIVMIKEDYYNNYFLMYGLTDNIKKFDSIDGNFKDKLLTI